MYFLHGDDIQRIDPLKANFSSNVAPWGPCQSVLEHLKTQAQLLGSYPPASVHVSSHPSSLCQAAGTTISFPKHASSSPKVLLRHSTS